MARGPGLACAAAGDERREDAPIAPAVVAQAIDWYVRMCSGVPSAQDRADFEQWLAARAEHADAWQRLQGIGVRIQGGATRLAPAAARSILTRAAEAVPARRRAFKTLAWAGAGAAALFVAQRQVPWRAELADERTGTGERRRLVLSDGTRLALNTATALDIRFDDRLRRIVLHSGEIQVSTARDRAGRPFQVATPEGLLVPVGTRFTVRRDERDAVRAGSATLLAVTEGAVRIHPQDAAGGAVLVQAGQQARFTRERVQPMGAVDEAAQSWVDGMLTAERMPLAAFVAELDRYRPGRIRCAPEVGGLLVTGVWPLEGDDATDRILASLERQLPVRVSRYTRYWVTVAAR